MAVHELVLDTLHKLDDGRVSEAWRQAVRRAVTDCEDRPGVGDARKITLTLELVPVCDEQKDLLSIHGSFQVADTLPKRKSRVYDFAPRNDGKLAFNDMSDDNAAQSTLDQIGGFDVEGSN